VEKKLYRMVMHEKLEAASEEGIPAALSGVSFVGTDRFVVVAVSSQSFGFSFRRKL
jgi:hypothetical protein